MSDLVNKRIYVLLHYPSIQIVRKGRNKQQEVGLRENIFISYNILIVHYRTSEWSKNIDEIIQNCVTQLYTITGYANAAQLLSNFN